MTLQILRTIDKFDKIGRDGVVELLQKPAEEFGADLDPVRAAMVGLFLDSAVGDSNEQTIANIERTMAHIAKIRGRLDLMCKLEDTVVDARAGETAWDRLLNMPVNADNTWTGRGRPRNVAWALDDLLYAVHGDQRAIDLLAVHDWSVA